MSTFSKPLLLVLILTACNSKITPVVITNEEGIPVSSMAKEGIDSLTINNLVADIEKDTFHNVHSLLIARHNKLVYEHYWPGTDGSNDTVHFTKETLHDLRSISKSITSACVGIALQQGKIKSIDQKVFEFFPEYATQDTGLKSMLTIRHLLTMTTGLQWDEKISYDSAANTEIKMDKSGNPVRFILRQPMQSTPGAVWNYNGGATQLLGSIIEKATGKKLDQFANEYLFRPLGITKFEWMNYVGIDLPSAPWGVRLRPRDMLKFGLLLSNKGKWNDKQLLPADWTEASTRFQVRLDEQPATAAGLGGYGYQFWTWSFDTLNISHNQLTMAIGYGGQRIIIDHINELIVVVTAGNYHDPHAGEKDEMAMWGEYIYPALLKNK